MTFDAFSSSKRANIKNGLARALCAFGGALLWMALVPFGDEASAKCPNWVGDDKTITCSADEYAADGGSIAYPDRVAGGTLKLVAPLTVTAEDDDTFVVHVTASDADPLKGVVPLTVEVGQGVVLVTSAGAPEVQQSVLNVESMGGKIVVRMDGKIESTDSETNVALGENVFGLWVKSRNSDVADAVGDIEVRVGGEIEVLYRTALKLEQLSQNGGIDLVIDDGASLTSGSEADGADGPEGGYSVVEAEIIEGANTKSLRVVIGTKVDEDQETENVKGDRRHALKIHAVAEGFDTDQDATVVFQVPAINLGHAGVGVDKQNQIDLQVFRGDLSSFGHGISAILHNRGALGNIRIELGSPGWRSLGDDEPEIPSLADVKITARSVDPDGVVLANEKQGIGVYASHSGRGGVWILARYVDIVADMEGIKVDTPVPPRPDPADAGGLLGPKKGVLIEIGHPGTATTKILQDDGTTTTTRGTLASRSNVVGRAGHAVHVEYSGSKGAVEISLFAGTIENQGHNAFTDDDPSDDESGRGIHAHITGWTLADVDQPSINPDDIVIQVGSRKDSDVPASVDYYGAGIRAQYQSAIGTSHSGLGGIEIEVTIAPDPDQDDDSFIGSIIAAEEAIRASVEREDNEKAIRIDIRGKPAVAAVPATTSDDGTEVAAIPAKDAVLAMFKTTGVNKRVIHALHRGVGQDPTDDATGDSSISISIKDSIIETEDMTVEHGGADDPYSDAYTTTAISSKAGIYAITRLATGKGSILVEVDGSRIKAGSPIHAIQKGLGMIAIVVRNSSPDSSVADPSKDSQALGLYANDVFYDSAEALLLEFDTLANGLDADVRQDALLTKPSNGLDMLLIHM